MSTLRRGQVVHKKTRRDKVYNNVSTTNVKKIPRWASLAAVGSTAGMIGNIILDRSTGSFCYHNGLRWVCFGGYSGNFSRINDNIGDVINIIREVQDDPPVFVIDGKGSGVDQIADAQANVVIAIPDVEHKITINLPEAAIGDQYYIKAIQNETSDVILKATDAVIRTDGVSNSETFSFRQAGIVAVKIMYTQKGVWDIISDSCAF